MHYLNTHTYDFLLPPLNFESSVKKDFSQLRLELSKRLNQHNQSALTYFDLIVNDGHNHQNFDQTNNIYADDLLYLLSINIESIPWEYFIEQLLDISTGSCPQGRTIRLFQIINTIYN